MLGSWRLIFSKLKIFLPRSIIIQVLIQFCLFFLFSVFLTFEYKRFIIFIVGKSVECLIYLLLCNLFISIAPSTKSFVLLTRLAIIRLIKLSCFSFVGWWSGFFPFLSFLITELALLNNLEPILFL